MLKLESDFTREFPVIAKTDRDAEVPVLLEFLKSHPTESLLDIGASGSASIYAPKVRELVQRYDAVDIVPDPETAKIVDHYITGNAIEMVPIIPVYDCVISVSVFEHCGISTYTADHDAEVYSLFKKCLELSKKYVWVSMDVGLPYLYPDQLSPITLPLYEKMLKFVSNFTVKERFFHSQGPQASHPWREHANKKAAFAQQYYDYIGNQSIAVIEIEK